MRKALILVAFTAAIVLSASPSCFAGQTKAPARPPMVKFTDYRLANGLRVILSVDHSAPVVAVSVSYDVGSRNERKGRTGFAHLFEHLMFQGSANVGKGEHMMLIQDNGGTDNGTTNKDRTNYFEALPANQLDLALFLESDRMRSLDLSQANLDNQRLVVEEEKRQSYDNQPYSEMGRLIDEMTFHSFAYQHETIGSMQDLDAATLDDVRQFWQTYYAPNNAALAIVGDFNEADAKKKVEKYFGDIPRHPAPPAVDISEPPPSGEKRKTITDPLARATRYEAVYLTVPGDHPDAEALSVLGTILSRGRTGRLYKSMVETKIALNAMAGGFASRGPGQFSCSATLPPGGSVDAVEKVFDAEIERVQKDGVTEEEIAKARAQARAAAIVGGGGGRRGGGGFGGLSSALGRANAFSQNAIFFNDPNRINTSLDRMEKVTAADVQRVAQKYLVKVNRTVVICEPEEPSDGFSLSEIGSRKSAIASNSQTGGQ